LQKASKIILGIDPGTLIMGFGLIEVSGSALRLLEMGVLRLPIKDDAYQRLEKIHQKVADLISTHQPNSFAIEAPFFGKNVQSMLKLGRAQGVAIAVAMQQGLPVTEYSPRKIKQSITGNGNAEKEQVWKMLKIILGIEVEKVSYDATDALAVAICHHYQGASGPQGIVKGHRGWEDFIKQNPGRIV
jgi:crossover junction endodeoxyribonuclease RuvC